MNREVYAASAVGVVALALLVRSRRRRVSRITYLPGIIARTPEEADDFYRDVYAGLGVQPTEDLLRFMRAWRLAEGGRAAWNPFNTKWKRGKASDYIPNGVANYPDRATGLAATLGTLRLRYYADLRSRMAAGAPAVDVASSADLKVWGTGDLVRRVLVANPGAIPYRSPIYGA